MFHGIIQPVISQFLMDLFFHGLPGNQPFQFALCYSFVHSFNKMSYDIIAAGIGPEILRSGVFVCAKFITIADHIPWTIDFQISKTVSVIPFLCQFVSVQHPIIFQKRPYLSVCKTIMLCKFYIGNGINLRIIKSRKNTLFCHPQASGQHRKLKAPVCLQRLFKHVPDQHDHLIIISVFTGLCQRNIILVDQDDDLLPIMLLQQQRQRLQAACQRRV